MFDHLEDPFAEYLNQEYSPRFARGCGGPSVRKLASRSEGGHDVKLPGKTFYGGSYQPSFDLLRDGLTDFGSKSTEPVSKLSTYLGALALAYSNQAEEVYKQWMTIAEGKNMTELESDELGKCKDAFEEMKSTIDNVKSDIVDHYVNPIVDHMISSTMKKSIEDMYKQIVKSQKLHWKAIVGFSDDYKQYCAEHVRDALILMNATRIDLEQNETATVIND